jgi:hypothetical protein
MKKLLKFIYVLGVIFWSTFLIYGLIRMVAYNGFGNYYSFTCRNASSFTIEEEANDNLKITYSYDVLGRVYDSGQRISGELFRKEIGSVSPLTICYNDIYPSLSYIHGINIAANREETGVIVSIIFLVFISIIYVYSKRSYWINNYKSFFKKKCFQRTSRHR